MSDPAKVMNPRVTMWTRPRATVRHLIETDPKRSVLLLAALSGVSQTLDRASTQSLGDSVSTSTILIIAVVAGPLFGLMSLYLGAALTQWTGRSLRSPWSWSRWVVEIGVRPRVLRGSQFESRQWM